MATNKNICLTVGSTRTASAWPGRAITANYLKTHFDMDYEKKYRNALSWMRAVYPTLNGMAKEDAEHFFPELTESDDKRIWEAIVREFERASDSYLIETYGLSKDKFLAYLEKQKENPKSADSIPADCVSDAKCENRWHKVQDSLPDNGRLVLAQDNIGNRLLARYDGEGNLEVSVYDNEDYYCRNTITKWCEIPSEKQSEEDERILKGIIGKIDHDQTYGVSKVEMLSFLKSLRPQSKQEWSEEDEMMLSSIIGTLKYTNGAANMKIDWLKSLRPSWKPSEEQMKALIDCVIGDEYDVHALVRLWAELKKLM